MKSHLAIASPDKQFKGFVQAFVVFFYLVFSFQTFYPLGPINLGQVFGQPLNRLSMSVNSSECETLGSKKARHVPTTEASIKGADWMHSKPKTQKATRPKAESQQIQTLKEARKNKRKAEEAAKVNNQGKQIADTKCEVSNKVALNCERLMKQESQSEAKSNPQKKN